MCSDRRKNHGCEEKKKQEAPALLGLASGPHAKCYELKRCADRVRSRTDNKDEVLEGKLVSQTFRLPTKRQLSILLNFILLDVLFPLIKLFLTFVVLAKTRVRHHVISRLKRWIRHRVISSVCHFILVTLWCGWTDGRSHDLRD